MTFATINSIAVHYRLEGNRDGPALVFSNSLGTDFRIWDEMVERLAGDFTVLRYDTRGHGLTDAPDGPYTMETLADDLAALIAHVGLKDPLVVGLSIGGMTAQSLSQRHAGLAKGFVLMDTAHKIGTEEMWNDRIAAIEKGGIAALADSIMQRWFTPGYRSPDNADFSAYTNMLVRTPVAGYIGCGCALRDADYTKETATLDRPTLCIVGDQDGSTPPDLMRETAAMIAGARLEIVENAGHLPCIEQPEVTASLVDDFARKVFFGTRDKAPASASTAS